MLTLTPQATTAIRSITEKSEAAEQGGLRISGDTADQSLAVSLAAVPADDDQVVDQDGARVFLDGKTATVLDDKTLDAGAAPSGSIQFAITETAG